jgi:hypothetical protein
MNILDEIKKLKTKLDESIKFHLLEVADSEQELQLISELMDKYPDKFKEGGLDFVVKDALEEAKAVVEDGNNLLKAYRLLHKGRHGKQERILREV